MSLLLEALKKAELAKQRATLAKEARAQDAPVEAREVMTRERLPDITQPVEIRTDDLPSAGEKPARIRLELSPPPSLEAPAPSAPPPPSRSPAINEPGVTRGMEAARRLFEVKEMDYNPRRPFYLTLTVLGVIAVGYGGYVWWQLQPRSSFNAQAIRDSQAEAAADKTDPPPTLRTAAASPALSASAAAAASRLVPPQPAERQAPMQALLSVPAPSTAVPAQPAVTPRRSSGTASTTLGLSAPTPPRTSFRDPAPVPRSEPRGSEVEPIAVNPPSLQIDPQLERAYDAVQKDDLNGAREIYQTILQRNPNQRDALLGLAAIDLKTRDFGTAEARYLKLLELDPRDSDAQAGLLAMRGQLDPVTSESRIKNLLANQPESPQLQFILGNQYALQSRWSEAQQAYFRAFTFDPENADYAFNLAVSLDHLRQKKAALDFYQRSLALAEKRPGSFDRMAAAARIRDLQK
jgi:tetratricopeptide (TPR) repeat protein